MKKFMKKMWEKKDSKKGFTLVELIVVLVILAVLAAIMVPSLIGWINKAKEKQHILEARNVYLATQTVVFERAKGSDKIEAGEIELTGSATDGEIKEVNDITGEDASKITNIVIDAGGVITAFTYEPDEFKATYTDGAWSISLNGK